jgi:hypothetical protein
VPENDILRLAIVLTALLFSFSLLYKIVDVWADSVKERRRLNSIIERTDQINHDAQDDPPGR